MRYLEHFCKVSSFSARNAKLEDVSLDSLKISTGSKKSFSIPIDPAMTAWTEARTRFASLDAEAVKGLGRSSITIKKFPPRNGTEMAFFAIAILFFAVFSKRSNFQSGSVFYGFVLRYFQGAAKFFEKAQPFIFYPVLVLHLVEATYMGQVRLEKHSVPRYSTLWWKWTLSTFVEGVGAFKRLDKMVKEEEEERAQKKH